MIACDGSLGEWEKNLWEIDEEWKLITDEEKMIRLPFEVAWDDEYI